MLSRRKQAKLLLQLKRTHRSKGTKMVMQRRSAHACDRCRLFHTQRFLVVLSSHVTLIGVEADV